MTFDITQVGSFLLTKLDVIGATSGVIGILLAIYFYYAGKKQKTISYICRNSQVIKGGKANISDLKVLYRDKEISELGVSKLLVWNSGKLAIRGTDFPSNDLLRATISKAASYEVLSISIAHMRTPTNNFKLISGENSAALTFEYMNPGDGLVIQILHTSTSMLDYVVEGTLLDGRIKSKRFDIPFPLDFRPSKKTGYKPSIRKFGKAFVVGGMIALLLSYFLNDSIVTSNLSTFGLRTMIFTVGIIYFALGMLMCLQPIPKHYEQFLE